MQFSPIKCFVLCGGSGTRLWPLSRKAYPKQFIPLVGEKSLLQLTLERLSPLGELWCISSEEHRFLVEDAARAAGTVAKQLLEPCARNTAPAIALAVCDAAPDDLLLFCPADQYIPDAIAFREMVKAAQASAMSGRIVTFGVLPTFPSTGYGYIAQGQPLIEGGLSVECFIEKPNPERAVELLASGRHLWNAGIFLAQAEVLAQALASHAPDIWRVANEAMVLKTRDGTFLRPDGRLFSSCPAESIDYAVMEKSTDLAVHKFTGAWSDVGSWNAVAELSVQRGDGNRSAGSSAEAHFMHATDTFIHASGRPIVALGTHQLLIVDTPDALLVADITQAESVKQVVSMLESLNAPQALSHRKVARPWGSYDSVDTGQRHQVKRITVRPGAKLSLQLHHHRAEHWVVVRGVALVTVGEKQIQLEENQSTYIPLGVKHRLENPGDTDLEIIEVQSGAYLGEDDIVRFEDTYGRISLQETK